VRVKLIGCEVPINVTRDEFRLILKRLPKSDIVVVDGSLNGNGSGRNQGKTEKEREGDDAESSSE
jgi:hypothetical protein